MAQVFDTYKSSKNFENFLQKQIITSGHIIVAACKDDCVNNLSVKIKKWFYKMAASKEIWSLKYRCGFALIGIYGKNKNRECFESVATLKN